MPKNPTRQRGAGDDESVGQAREHQASRASGAHLHSDDEGRKLQRADSGAGFDDEGVGNRQRASRETGVAGENLDDDQLRHQRTTSHQRGQAGIDDSDDDDLSLQQTSSRQPGQEGLGDNDDRTTSRRNRQS